MKTWFAALAGAVTVAWVLDLAPSAQSVLSRWQGLVEAIAAWSVVHRGAVWGWCVAAAGAAILVLVVWWLGGGRETSLGDLSPWLRAGGVVLSALAVGTGVHLASVHNGVGIALLAAVGFAGYRKALRFYRLLNRPIA